MSPNPTPDYESGNADSIASFDHALLCLLVDPPVGLWSVTELDRSLSHSSESRSGDEPTRVDTEDAIQRLYAAGMIHRLGHYVFATRAAHAVQRLEN
jgi:hypothetical protein